MAFNHGCRRRLLGRRCCPDLFLKGQQERSPKRSIDVTGLRGSVDWVQKAAPARLENWQTRQRQQRQQGQGIPFRNAHLPCPASSKWSPSVDLRSKRSILHVQFCGLNATKLWPCHLGSSTSSGSLHLRPFTKSRAASTIRACEGITWFSRVSLNGIGTSIDAMRRMGASSQSNALSTTIAATSAPRPPV